MTTQGAHQDRPTVVGAVNKLPQSFLVASSRRKTSSEMKKLRQMIVCPGDEIFTRLVKFEAEDGIIQVAIDRNGVRKAVLED